MAGHRTPEHRAKISEGAKRAWDRYYETIGQQLPPTKKCNACGQVKKVDSDPALSEFGLRKKKNRHGVYLTANPECRRCEADRAARARARKSRDELAAARKRHYANRDREKVKAYNREYSRLRREQEGVPARGGWIKYQQNEVDPRIDRKPFDDWMVKSSHTPTDLAKLTGISDSVFRRNGPYLSLSTVDKVFTALGIPDQVAVLWPADAGRRAA